jgi:CHAT domain
MNVPSSIKTILVLTANPKSTLRLRLDEQVRDIKQGLDRSQNRDQFKLVQEWAVRPRDIHRAMLDIKPNIVHFSGHGNGDDGLVFEDENGNPKLVEGAALARLFDLFSDTIECVVLNGCYSAIQAESISQYIENVIGMTESIGDQAAIEFSVGFYDALGAGRTVDFAYQLGCNAIRLSGIPEESVPILIKKQAISTQVVSTQKNDSKVEWGIILSGTFDDNVKKEVEAIIDHFNKLSGDTSLTLKKKTSPGSTVLNANDYGCRNRYLNYPDEFFKLSDFEEYNKQSLNILYLMIRKDINPKALSAAFDKLMKKTPGVNLNSIEKFDCDIIIGVQMPIGIDKGVVERTFYKNYQYELQTTDIRQWEHPSYAISINT